MVSYQPRKTRTRRDLAERYETGGVFFARLLPVVRHLISIPAGIVRMNFVVFSIVTIAGSAIWCTVLAYLGLKAYHKEPQLLSDPEAMVHFIKTQSYWIVLIVLALTLLYLATLRLDQARFQIRQWCSKRRHECRRFVYLGVTVERSAR